MNRRLLVLLEGYSTARRWSGWAPDMVIPRNIVNIRDYVARFEDLNHLHPTAVVLGGHPEGAVGG